MSKESLFKRLAKNAEAMGAAGLIDNAYMDARSSEVEKLLREYAGYDQLSIEWYKKKLAEESAKLWERSSPKINAPDKAINGILKGKGDDARFKTLHETGTTYGLPNPDIRNKVENELFGTNMTVEERADIANFAKNPVYGWQDAAKKNYTRGYGQNEVTLKPNVKDRMTYSFGDSIDNGSVGGRYGFSDWTAFLNPDKLKSMLNDKTMAAEGLWDEVKDYKQYYKDAEARGDTKAMENWNKAINGKMQQVLDMIGSKGEAMRENMYSTFENIKSMNNPDVQGAAYIENQYHGGVKKKDIESVKNQYGNEWDLKTGDDNTTLVLHPYEIEQLYPEYGIDPKDSEAFGKLSDAIFKSQRRDLIMDKNKLLGDPKHKKILDAALKKMGVRFISDPKFAAQLEKELGIKIHPTWLRKPGTPLK